jgi:hypothetical protein
MTILILDMEMKLHQHLKMSNWSGQLEKRCEVFFLRVNDKTSGTTAANML